MLEVYYVRPETMDRIRSSWIGKGIEDYATWLHANRYAPRSVLHRIPIAVQFGDFARSHGATRMEELPDHVEAFVNGWVAARTKKSASAEQREKVGQCVRNPIRQMLRLLVPGYSGLGRPHKPENPFVASAPGFFEFLYLEMSAF